MKMDNTWYSLPYIKENVECSLVGMGLDPGGITQWNAYYTDLYGTLPTGNYRIIKDVSVGKGAGSYRNYYLGAEFTIE